MSPAHTPRDPAAPGVHPAAELLGHPLEIQVKGGRGELHQGGLLVSVS